MFKLLTKHSATFPVVAFHTPQRLFIRLHNHAFQGPISASRKSFQMSKLILSILDPGYSHISIAIRLISPADAKLTTYKTASPCNLEQLF